MKEKIDIPVQRDNKKYIIRIFAYLLFLILPLVSLGRQYSFKNYNIEDGLAQSQVRTIFQDSRGYLWIGTSGGGVSKYDGFEFTNLSTKDGLNDNIISSIIEDHNGNLWFGTYNGTCKYDRKTFTSITKEDGLSHNIVLSILEDHEDNLWFGTDGGGVCKYDGKTFTTITKEDGLSHNIVLSILEDREGNLWFGTDGGISRYDGLTFTNFTEEDGLSNNRVRSILEDREGNLWLGTDRGISRYDGLTFTNFTEEDGLSNNTVWSILEDREGNLWFGTYRGGIDKYRISPFIHFTTEDGLTDNIVRSILEDQKGNLWFGTYKGGVDKFDGKSFTNLSKRDGLVDNFVLTILEDQKGNLWFGTYRGASKYDGKTFTNFTEKDGLSDNEIRSILEDQKGNLWFGTDSGGICKFDGVSFTTFTTKDGLNDDEIMTIFEDRKGNLWVGTNRGINVFNSKDFINFTEKHGLKENDPIFTIIEDQKGNLWFGAYGGGIIKYSPSCLTNAEQEKNKELSGSFQTFSSKDGLHDDNVVSMSFDDAGNLWIGTERGIEKLNIELYEKTGEKAFKHYGIEDGFIGIECIHNSVCRDSKGKLWFGTLRGAVKYTAKDDRPNKIEPITNITNLRLFFKEVDWSAYTDWVNNYGLPIELKLPYNQNHITFDFNGISLVIPEKVRYQYKLEGFDKAWSPVSKEKYATYSHLSPGKYTFDVKSSNNDGLWNKEPISFSFEITPPFWQKWWFYSLTLLLIIGSIRTYTKLRVKKLEKINLELEKLTLVASRTENAVMIADASGLMEWVNEGFIKIIGFTLEELRELKRDTIEKICPNPGKADNTDESIVRNKSIMYECKCDTKDGKVLWISLSITPIFGKCRELKRLIAIGTDITERKLAEDALMESEERYRELVEKAGIAILTDDKEGKITYANKKAAEIYGYSIEELKEQSIQLLVHPDEFERVMKFHKARIKGKKVPSSYVFKGVKKDGSTRYLELEAAPNKKGEEVIGTRLYIKDITARKKGEEEREQLQSQLVQSAKMAGVGTLTGGIAHEFNNLLQIMSGHTEFAQRTKKPEDMEEALERVENTSDRLSKIIKDLLTFSRREPLERKICHISELAEFVLSMTEEQLKKHNIEVIREYRKTPNVEINKDEMQQVFLNMITNARDAMTPKGGKLEIEIKRVKDNVEISFTDTGIGIEEENLGGVFEPFYTTKGAVGGDEKIQGIGLGLSVSYGIVERHGGTIKVESEVGRGTTFTIKLPVKEEKAKKRIVKEKRKVKAEKIKSMNVLVVDDEEEICKIFTKWLSAEGYKVKSALTGEEALRQVNKTHFDVVFLDVIMPGIPSLIVLEEIKKISPKTKVVMITGRMLDKEFKKELKEKGAPGFIQKPFKLEDILGFLR